jgi:hypothetical protein
MDFEHGRRVGIRIEAHGDQAYATCESCVRLHETLDFAESAVKEGAILRQRTTCVDKSDRQGVSAEPRDAQRLSTLVDERRVWNRVTFVKHAHACGRRGVRDSVDDRCGADLIDACEPGAGVTHGHCRVDEITCRPALDQAPVVHLVRHGHRRHEPFDVVVLDEQLAV